MNRIWKMLFGLRASWTVFLHFFFPRLNYIIAATYNKTKAIANVNTITLDYIKSFHSRCLHSTEIGHCTNRFREIARVQLNSVNIGREKRGGLFWLQQEIPVMLEIHRRTVTHKNNSNNVKITTRRNRFVTSLPNSCLDDVID